MPCRYDGPDDDKNYLLSEVNRLTRVSCDMRTILRRNSLEQECTKETRKWIEEHDLADAKRIKEENRKRIRENTRLRALEKLTLEERRVLNL